MVGFSIVHWQSQLLFAGSEFPVRTVVKDGEPWFVANDVCTAIGVKNPTMALRALDESEQQMITLSSTEGIRGNPNANAISEGGMYTLVLRCRQATTPDTAPHAFRKWVKMKRVCV